MNGRMASRKMSSACCNALRLGRSDLPPSPGLPLPGQTGARFPAQCAARRHYPGHASTPDSTRTLQRCRRTPHSPALPALPATHAMIVLLAVTSLPASAIPGPGSPPPLLSFRAQRSGAEESRLASAPHPQPGRTAENWTHRPPKWTHSARKLNTFGQKLDTFARKLDTSAPKLNTSARPTEHIHPTD